MTPISKELQDQIEREAEVFKMEPHYRDGSALSVAPQIYLKRGYIAGATTYAHYKEHCEELERWKREAIELLTPLLDYGQSKEAGIPLGKSITAVILQRAKQFEQAKKALEEIKKAISIGSNWHADRIATEAIASWKEEGKEGGV